MRKFFKSSQKNCQNGKKRTFYSQSKHTFLYSNSTFRVPSRNIPFLHSMENMWQHPMCKIMSDNFKMSDNACQYKKYTANGF